MVAANEAGCINILVKTGSGTEAYNKYINSEFYDHWGEVKTDYIAEDINDAVKWLMTNKQYLYI